MRTITVLWGILCFIILSCPVSGETFTVILTTDGGYGSLRWAITEANSLPGQDIIEFDIWGANKTLVLQSPLPALVDPDGVIIDGLSQSGAVLGGDPPASLVLKIEIQGFLAGPCHGLLIQSSNNIIKGLVINDFQQDGIRMETGPNQDSVTNNLIMANFIGTDITGTARVGNGNNQAGSWAGVHFLTSAETPGVVSQNIISQNLISANYSEGVRIESGRPVSLGGEVSDNHVVQNYIGTDISGTMPGMGNDHAGVYIGDQAYDNQIRQNIISGNGFNSLGFPDGYSGVCIIGYPDEIQPLYCNNNLIFQNMIGLSAAMNPLPNGGDGVSIGQYGELNTSPVVLQLGFAQYNQIMENTIAYNTHNGITVWEDVDQEPGNTDENPIRRNAVYENDRLGIDLDDDGVTVNDYLDMDSRANENLNYPEITAAGYCAGYTEIRGVIRIDTDPLLAYVEVFRAQADPSQHGEGARFLGGTQPVDDHGNWRLFISWDLILPGDKITATTTDVNGNTSEFSHNFTVETAACGDLNEDWDTDSADVLLLAGYLAGNNPDIPAGEESADFNGDGFVDSTDLALLLNYIVGNL